MLDPNEPLTLAGLADASPEQLRLIREVVAPVTRYQRLAAEGRAARSAALAGHQRVLALLDAADRAVAAEAPDAAVPTADERLKAYASE